MSSHSVKYAGSLRVPVLVAILGGLALLGLYLGILTAANSLEHAADQLIVLWPWFSALIVGFGLQMGLYNYMRRQMKIHHVMGGATTKGVAATGSVSTAAMAACCAHHLSDILPVVGFTGAAVFFGEYQEIFLLLGVFSNVVGITMMLHIMQKHGLMESGHPFFEKICRWNIPRILRWNLGISIVLLTVALAVKVYAQYF